MPDIFMDVDVALASVPVNIAALIDDSDFKSREESVVYNQAGLDLVWNFKTCAGVMTQTPVTPTDGGDYAWTNLGNAMYAIRIPASAGASINNNAKGEGWFTGFATGILPWRGPIICFRDATLNDKLIESAWSATRGLTGTAVPDAAADAPGGLPISDAGGLDMDALAMQGDEMDLVDAPNADALEAIGAKVEAMVLDEGDATALLAAIAAKIEEFLINEGDATATLAAIAAACNAAIEAGAVGVAAVAIQERTDNLPDDPADASVVAADIAAVKGDTAAILADTGTDGVIVASGSKTGYALATDGISAAAISTAALNKMCQILGVKFIANSETQAEIYDRSGALVVTLNRTGTHPGPYTWTPTWA